MTRWVLLVSACLFCMGTTCQISCNGVPDQWDDGYVALDLATVQLTIMEQAGGGQADVHATLETQSGRLIELLAGQAVEVNGQPLTGPDTEGDYTARVDVAESYQIRVIEPTRGVFTTNVAAPAAFAITQPVNGGDASLSGFTMTWSNPDPDLAVRIELQQTLPQLTTHFGEVELDSDSGSHSFDAAFLSSSGFQQGAPIQVLLTKTSRQTDLEGFAQGQAIVERSVQSTLLPAP